MTGKPDPLVSVAERGKIPGYTSIACLFTWLGTKGDYASIGRRDQALKGWRRHFSTCTTEGRLNIVVATYLTTGLVGLYLWKKYKDSKTKPVVDGGRVSE